MKRVFKDGDLVCPTNFQAICAACVPEDVAGEIVGLVMVVEELSRANEQSEGYFTSPCGWRIPLKACKPVVHYIGYPSIYNGRAHLTVIDHPELGAETVTTSTVLRHGCGIIETRNTVYIPAGNAKFKKVS